MRIYVAFESVIYLRGNGYGNNKLFIWHKETHEREASS